MQSVTLIFSRPSITAISLEGQHAQAKYPTTHHLPTSTGSADHIKVIARLRRRVWVDGLHQLLEDHERR
jgi:hypothetical protein